jgi:hypothetical protein
MYTQTLKSLADIADATSLSRDDVAVLRTPSVVLHAGAAVFLLIVATTLAVYKPAGLTRYGWRKQNVQRPTSRP